MVFLPYMKKIIFNQGEKERLDKFLVANFSGYSRAKLQKMIEAGSILVNNEKVAPHHFLKNQDVISIEISKSEKPKNQIIKNSLDKKTGVIEPEIITDAPDYLIIEKPAGLIVHHGEGPRKQPALTDWLLKKYPAIKKVGENALRPGIVHRLDKEVSGLMVAAKNQPMFLRLKAQFKNREALKEYLALVYGKISADEGIINFPIERSKITGKMAAKPKNTETAREAITEFSVLHRYVNYTYLKITIKTGRTHQIRSHLQAYGHPIVGDKLYFNKKTKPANLERPFLHSAKLGFYDLNNNWQEFNDPLPMELHNFLNNLHETK